MSKILKNTTITAVGLGVLGLPDIPANGQIEIQVFDYVLLASNDSVAYLDPLIASGDIVVNTGSTDLSAAEGKRFIRWVPPLDVQFYDISKARIPHELNFEGDVSVTSENNGTKVTVKIGDLGGDFSGKLLDFEFSSNGNTFNKWLNVGHPSTPSNQVPFVAEWSGDAIGMSFSNANDLSNVDIEYHINGTLGYVWQIRDKRTAYNTSSVTPFFSVNQGDRVSIFARRVGSNQDPANIFGEVVIRVDAIVNGSGGQGNM